MESTQFVRKLVVYNKNRISKKAISESDAKYAACDNVEHDAF